MPRSCLSLEREGSLLCACGRFFSQPGALNKHRNVCPGSKKCLAGALDKAKHLWTGTKRRHSHIDTPETSQPPPAGLIPQAESCTACEVSELLVCLGIILPSCTF